MPGEGGAEYLLGFGVDPSSFNQINEELQEGIKGAVKAEINVVVIGDTEKIRKSLAKPITVDVLPNFTVAAQKKLKEAIESVFAGSANGIGQFGKDVKGFQMGATALQKAVTDLKSLDLHGFASGLAKQVSALHAALNQSKSLSSGGGSGGGGGKNAARNAPRDNDTDAARRSMVTMHGLDANNAGGRAGRVAFYEGYRAQQYPGYSAQTVRRQLPPQPESTTKNAPYFRQTERFENTRLGRIPRSVTMQDIESSFSMGQKFDTELEDRYMKGADKRIDRARNRAVQSQVRIKGYTSPTSFDKNAKKEVAEILRDLNAIEHDTKTALHMAEEVKNRDIGGVRYELKEMEAELQRVNAKLASKKGNAEARKGLKIRQGDLQKMIEERQEVQVRREDLMLELQRSLGELRADIDKYTAEENRLIDLAEKAASDRRRTIAAQRAQERVAAGAQAVAGAVSSTDRLRSTTTTTPQGYRNRFSVQGSALGGLYGKNVISQAGQSVSIDGNDDPALIALAKRFGRAQARAQSAEESGSMLGSRASYKLRDEKGWWKSSRDKIEAEMAARQQGLDVLASPTVKEHTEGLKQTLARIEQSGASDPTSLLIAQEIKETVTLREKYEHDFKARMEELNKALANADANLKRFEKPTRGGAPRSEDDPSRSDNWLLGQMGGNFMPSGEGAVRSYQHDRGRYIDPQTGQRMSYGEIENIDRRLTKYGELPYRSRAFDKASKERITQDIMGAPQALEDINNADRLRKAERRAAERQGAIPGSVWMSDKSKANAQARLGQERVRLVQQEIEQLQWAETSVNTVLKKLEADKVKLIAEGAAEEVLALKEGDAAAARQLGENIAHDRALREKQILELVEEGEKLNVAATEANAPGEGGGRRGRGGHGRGMGGAFTNMWQYALIGGAMYGAQSQARLAMTNAITTDDDTWQYKHATQGAERMTDWDAFFKKSKDASRVFSAYFAKDQKEIQESFTETYRLTDPAADKWSRLNTAILATAKTMKFTAITGGDASETLKAMNAAAAGLGTTLHSTGGRMDDIMGKIVALSATSLTGEAGSRQGIKTEGAGKGILDILARTGAAGRSLGLSDDYQLGLAATLEKFAPGRGAELGALVAKLYANLPKAGGHTGINHVSPRFGTPYAEGDLTHMIPQIAADMQGAHSGFQIPNNVQPLIQIMRQKGFAETLEKNVTLSRGTGKEAVDAAFEQRMETTAKKIERMRFEWEALASSVAEKLLPVIADLADKITGVIANFQNGDSAVTGFGRALVGLVAICFLFKAAGAIVNGAFSAFTNADGTVRGIRNVGQELGEMFTVGITKGAIMIGIVAAAAAVISNLGRSARDEAEKLKQQQYEDKYGKPTVAFRNLAGFRDIYHSTDTSGMLADKSKGGLEWTGDALGSVIGYPVMQGLGVLRSGSAKLFGGEGMSMEGARKAMDAEAEREGIKGGVGDEHRQGLIDAAMAFQAQESLRRELEGMKRSDPKADKHGRGAQIAKLLAVYDQVLPQMDAIPRSFAGSVGAAKLPREAQLALQAANDRARLQLNGTEVFHERTPTENLGAGTGEIAKAAVDAAMKGANAGSGAGKLKQQVEDLQRLAQGDAAKMGQEQGAPDDASNTWEARLAAFRARLAAFGTAMDALKEKQDDYRHHTDMARMAVEGLAAQEQLLNQIYQGRKIPIEELRHELKLQQEKLAAQLDYVGAIKEEARMGQFATYRAGQLAKMIPTVEWAPGDPAGGPLARGKAGAKTVPALPGGGSLSVRHTANVADLAPPAKAGLDSLRGFLAQAGEHGEITSGRDGHAGVSSQHNLGLAVDLKLANAGKMPEFVGALRSKGFNATFERKGQINANGSQATGDHIHIDFGKKGSGPQSGMVTTSAALDQHAVAQVLASTMNYANKLGIGPLGAVRVPYAGLVALNAAGARERAAVGSPEAAITGVGGMSMRRLLMGDAQQNETVKQSEETRHRLHQYLLAADKDAAQMKVTLIQQSAAVEKIIMEMAETEGQILSRPFTDAIDKRAEALRMIEVQYKEHNRMVEDASVIAQLYGDNIDGVRVKLKNTSQELSVQTGRMHLWQQAFRSSSAVYEGVQRFAFAAGEGNIRFGLQEGQEAEASKRAARMKQADLSEGKTPLKNSEYLARATQDVEKGTVTQDFLAQLQRNGVKGAGSVQQFYQTYQGFFRRIGAPEWIEKVLREGGFSRASLNALGSIRDKAKEDRDKNEGLFDTAHQSVGQLTEQVQQLANKELFDRWKDDLDDCARDMKILNDHMGTGKELASAMGVEYERTQAFLADSAEMLGHMVDKAELLKQKLKDLDVAEAFSKSYYKLIEMGASPEQAQAIMSLVPGAPAAPPPSQKEIDDQRDKTNIELSGSHQEIVQRVMSRIGQRPYAYDLVNSTQMLGMDYARNQVMAGYSPDRIKDMREARGQYVQGLQGSAQSAMAEAAKKIVDQNYRAGEIKSRLDEMVKSIQSASAAHESTTEAEIARADIEKQLAAAQIETVKQQQLYNDALQASVELQKIAKNNEEVRFYQDTIKNAAMEWATGRGVQSRGRRGESVLVDRFKEAFKTIGGASYERNISRRIDGTLEKFFGKVGLTEIEPPQIKAQNTNTEAVKASTEAIKALTDIIKGKAAGSGSTVGLTGDPMIDGFLMNPNGTAGANPNNRSTSGLAAFGVLGALGMGLDAAKGTRSLDGQGGDNYYGKLGATLNEFGKMKTGKNSQQGARFNKGHGQWGAQDYGAALGDAFGAYQAGADSGGGVGGALMGAVQGGMIGAQFGPVGMWVGAGIGLLGSIFGSGEKHRQVTEKIFNQMPRRQDVLYAAGAYLPFSAYAGGRFSRFEFAIHLPNLMVSSPAMAQQVGQAVSDAVAPMVRAQFARGPVTMRGT